MVKRVFKSQEQVQAEKQAALSFGRVVMPIDKHLLIYARQSTKEQLANNKGSTEQQTTDLLARGLDLGWSQEDTTIFIENHYTRDGSLSDKIHNASGRLRIDQRAGLQTIKTAIESSGVGAVMAWDVSRLFRDEDMIEPAIFVKTCKQYKVLVITEDDLYNFNDTRHDDRKRFLDEAQAAADFITKHVRKMHNAKDKVGMRGEYIGGVVPIGFILDEERTHFVPYSPQAIVVAKLFKRFRELEGNLHRLGLEVYQVPVFPEYPSEWNIHTGGRVKVRGGYTFGSQDSLKQFLTNVAYIGYMSYKGQVIRDGLGNPKKIHDAIVNPDDFWFAFNLLNDTNIDGVPIERERRVVRYQQKTTPPSTALLSGVRVNGQPTLSSEKYNIYAHHAASGHTLSYAITNTLVNIGPSQERHIGSIQVVTLDKIVTDKIWERVGTFKQMHELADKLVKYLQDKPTLIQGMQQWTEQTAQQLGLQFDESSVLESPYFQMQAMQQQTDTKLVSVDDTIAEYQLELSRLDREYRVNFDLMTDKELRDNKLKSVRIAKQIDELKQKQQDAQLIQEEVQEGHKLLASIETWDKWDIENKRRFIRLVTHTIRLDRVEHGWLRLTVEWSPFIGIRETDIAYIWIPSGRVWSDEENAILYTHYPNGMRSVLLDLLPIRTWATIKRQSMLLGIQREYIRNDTDMPIWLSRTDERFLEKHGLVLDGHDRRVWWHSVTDTNNERIS